MKNKESKEITNQTDYIPETSSINNSKYSMVKILRKQPNISVYLAKDIKTGSLSIIKSIDISSLSEYALKISKQEVKIISTLDYPYIIKQKEFFYTKSSNNTLLLNLVIEYSSGGDLSQSIKLRKSKYFSENTILDWFTQLCLSIKHLHDRKILHRDIKPSNIFLQQNGLIKIGDFGLAKCLHHSKERAITVIGSPEYLSPEILLNRPYSFKSDIWAMGVTLFELCALKIPFNDKDMKTIHLTKKIPNVIMNIPKHYTKELKEMIMEMLKGDPIYRPNIMKLLMNDCVKKRIRKFISKEVYEDEFSHTMLKDFDINKDERKECTQCVKAKKEKNMTANIINNAIPIKMSKGSCSSDGYVNDINDVLYNSSSTNGHYFRKEDIIQGTLNTASVHYFKLPIKHSKSPIQYNNNKVEIINSRRNYTPYKIIIPNSNQQINSTFNRENFHSKCIPLLNTIKSKDNNTNSIETKRKEIESLINPLVLKDISYFLANYLQNNNKINKELFQDNQIYYDLFNYLSDCDHSYEDNFKGISHLEDIYDLLQSQQLSSKNNTI